MRASLSLFADGALTNADAAAVETHLAGCADCRGVLTDLERLRTTARSLGPMRPPDHLWHSIAARLQDDARQAPLRSRAGVAEDAADAPFPRRAASRPAWYESGGASWLSLAAALLIVTLGIYLVDRPAAAPPPPVDNAQAHVAVESIAQELDLALQHYDHAVADLEALATDDTAGVDPAVTATVQQNLAAVDRAIAESRAALARDPQSESARASLVDALRQKVTMLRSTVSLINTIRDGSRLPAVRPAQDREGHS
jgi:hypothetical protein